MMKFEVEIPKHLLDNKEIELPKYSSSIINLININARATRPESIGNLSQFKEKFKGETLEEFKKFLLNINPKIIEAPVNKILKKAEEMELYSSYINYGVVKNWVENLVFVKTFRGLSIEMLCFETISKRFNMEFSKGTFKDESKTIDGYLDNKPYNVKPSSHKHKHSKSTKVKCDIIYYTIKKNVLAIEYDEI